MEMSSQVDSTTEMTQDELTRLQEAFFDGRYVGSLEEHEGATHTFLYEVPHGHVGFTVGLASGGEDIHLSANDWVKEKHHELDEWVWHKAERIDE